MDKGRVSQVLRLLIGVNWIGLPVHAFWVWSVILDISFVSLSIYAHLQLWVGCGVYSYPYRPAPVYIRVT